MMRFIAIVIKEGEDLREAMEKAVEEHKITAGTVISCVGAVRNPTLRMAGTGREHQSMRSFEGDYEIVSATGVVSPSRFHVHIALSDKDGNVIGGHLKGRITVHIITELVILAEDSIQFIEKEDPETGWHKVLIEKVKHGR